MLGDGPRRGLGAALPAPPRSGARGEEGSDLGALPLGPEANEPIVKDPFGS